MSDKTQVGFRLETQFLARVREIAEKERRSIGSLLTIMVVEQLKRYNEGGFSALLHSK